ncbi:hypothetical protein IW262DRAFT_1393565 [Armillaria fumosa]|nr:hypothetical protein IW262DRAFT_1393565 [Armillaria fumosa]
MRGINLTGGKLAVPVGILVGLGVLVVVDVKELVPVTDCVSTTEVPFQVLGRRMGATGSGGVSRGKKIEPPWPVYIVPSRAYYFSFCFPWLMVIFGDINRKQMGSDTRTEKPTVSTFFRN